MDDRVDAVARVIWKQRWLVKAYAESEEHIDALFDNADPAVRQSCFDEAEEFLERLDMALMFEGPGRRSILEASRSLKR